MGQQNLSTNACVDDIFFQRTRSHTIQRCCGSPNAIDGMKSHFSGRRLPKMFAFEENYICGEYDQLHRDGSSE